MRSALLRDITRRVVVIYYQRFGTTCRFHLRGPESLKMGLTVGPEMSVRNNHYSPRNEPEESSSQIPLQSD
jgi:hypothetical protein